MRMRPGYVPLLFLVLTSCHAPEGDAPPWALLLLGWGGQAASGSTTDPGVVATPQFSPAPGIYLSTQSVTISADPGATIRYTTNGSAPTPTSDVYTGPIGVSADTTLRAVAVKNGQSSTVASAAYSVWTTSLSLVDRTVTFPSAMQTSVFPAFVAEAFDGSTWHSIPVTGTTLTWSDPQTLVIHLSWVRFPENSSMRLTLSGLQAAGGEPVGNDVHTFTTTTANASFPVADTGQSACYDNSVALATCGSTSFPRQDGDFANTPNARSFTGPTQYGAADYTTTDNVTGLVWKTCSEGKSGSDCATGSAATFSWYDAINACATLNTANNGVGYGGKTNWRLATRREFITLPNWHVTSSGVDDAKFPGTVAAFHWTATAFAGDADASDAWHIFNDGGHYSNGGLYSKTDALPVRCVAGSGSLRAYTDSGNGTIHDDVTNLVWQKCSAGQNNDFSCSGTASTFTWQAALTYCNSLSLGGRSWRLPNIAELNSLVDEGLSNPATNTTYFPATKSSPYWSSTTYVYAGSAVFAWFTDFSDGHNVWPGMASSGLKSSSSAMYQHHARCVSGP